MLSYSYTENQEGGKILVINQDNDIIMMNLHDSVEGHTQLLDFLSSEDNLTKYVNYLASNPNREFNINEILNL